MVGLSNVDNTTDLLKPISIATQTALDLKAPLASPTFTGTVSGITKSMVGLSNVDNTTDLLKPISTATQTALDLKAPLASPTFTGTVSGVTKSMVGLSNVDNTSDANKPVSSATQTALNLKYDASNPSGYISGITSGQVTTALGFTPENAANKGINNGYASLDGAGKVPSSQLPSYVDDVVEVANYAALPATGETGKIYVTIDTNYIYRWTGSVYVEIKDSSAVWGAITGTLSNQTDLQNALNAKFDDPTGDTTQYIAGDGSLITFPTAGQAGTLVREVRNTTGATLTKGTIVYISGATGNKPTVSKAIATGDSTSAQTFGMLQANIANNANGYAVCVGDLSGLDTSALTEGQQLYLSGVTAGAYTTTKSVAPIHLVYIGVVTRSHPTQGQIEVKIQNGYELDEIHDVLITSKANNDGLFYESSTSLWKNKSIATVLGYSPEQPLTFNSPLSRSTNAVSIPAATTSVNGYLTSADWTTFNAKQAALSGTGFVKISGTTISYDNSTYLTTSSAASTYLALAGGTLTGAVTGTRLSLSQNSADITLSISNLGTGRAFSVLGTSYFSSDISFGSLSNGILKANALGTLVLAIAGTDYQAPLSGTGFVKISGSTISYDNSTYALDSAVVKLAGTQTITGNKGFTVAPTFDSGAGFKNPSGLYNYISATDTGWKMPVNFNKEHIFVLNTSTAYTYTFPSATGTLALTSDLGAYLPLAGGTLTGALNGTSALFSGAVRANNPAEGATGEGLIAGQSFKIDGTGTSQKAVMYMVSNVLSDTYASGLTAQFANFAGDKAFGFNLNTSGGFELYVKNTSFNKALTISNTNAVTLTGALSGTSATFSATLNVSTIASGLTAKIGSETDNAMAVTLYGGSVAGNSNNVQLRFQGRKAAVDQWAIGNAVATGDNTRNFDIYDLVSGFNALRIAGSTGAATFSSSVTAGSTSSGAQINVFSSSYGNNGLFNAYGTDGNLKLQMGGLGTNEGFIYTGPSNKLSIYTGGSTSMTISSAGNVGIGTTTPSGASGLALAINGGANQTRIALKNSFTGDGAGNGFQVLLDAGAADVALELRETGSMRFATSSTERMRITSGGYTWATNSSYSGSSANHQFNNSANGNTIINFYHQGTDPYGLFTQFTGSAPNNTTNYFAYFRDTSGAKCVIFSNGNIQNSNNSYGAISDIKLKENITDASSKLTDLLKVKIRNYNLIGDTNKQIGVIAQELEEVFPSLIEETEDRDNNGYLIGTKTKSVKYSVFVPMLIKAVQELSDKITTLKNK